MFKNDRHRNRSNVILIRYPPDNRNSIVILNSILAPSVFCTWHVMPSVADSLS